MPGVLPPVSHPPELLPTDKARPIYGQGQTHYGAFGSQPAPMDSHSFHTGTIRPLQDHQQAFGQAYGGAWQECLILMGPFWAAQSLWEYGTRGPPTPPGGIYGTYSQGSGMAGLGPNMPSGVTGASEKHYQSRNPHALLDPTPAFSGSRPLAWKERQTLECQGWQGPLNASTVVSSRPHA